MSRFAIGSAFAGGVVALIFLAGFFHADKAPEPEARPAPRMSSPPRPAALPPPTEAREESLKASADFAGRHGSGGLLALTSTPAYKRAGDLTLRVEDCTKAEDALEAKLTAIKGEIVDMIMEGTEGSRTCTLSAIIPADQFRSFISDLRKMGKVQSERITASKLRPGQGDGAAALAGDPDPRELSLVSVRMADEKVAQNVLESRGVLATSYDRSTSHFLKGLAVMVELFGLLLPFLIALAAIAAPILVVAKLRRSRAASV